jgi:hypothetical protein
VCKQLANGDCRWQIDRNQCNGVLIRNDIDRIKQLVADVNKPLIAVTLSGQVARTEVQSKLKYLLDSTNKRHNFVLIIVMNDGATRFTNFENTQQSTAFNGTLHQLADAFAKSTHWPIIALQTDNDEIARQTPLIATRFFRSQTWSKDIWHRVSTVSQQFSKAAFATSIVQHVEQQLQFKFDYVVKLRDDDLLLATFDLNYLIDQLVQNNADIAVVGCVATGGVNDHLRVMTRRSLSATSYDLLTMVFVIVVMVMVSLIFKIARCID